MKRSIWRGAVVAAAVGALAVGLVPAASAGVPISPDPSPGLNVPATVDTWRIAGNTRIQTAIEAANVRTDWGRGQVTAIFKCNPAGVGHDNQTAPASFAIGVPVTFPIFVIGAGIVNQTCTPTVVNTRVKDVVIARDSDFPDALASAPLADVLNAPVLLNPTDAHPASGDTRGLDDDVLAYLTAQRTTAGLFVVHLMGGTNALSADVQTQINALGPNVLVVRHQGADRYQTAVSVGIDTIGAQIFNWLLLTGGRGPFPSFGNVYLTTGLNFPDALTAGAAASNNSGVVLLTKGPVFDQNPSGNSFTYDFIAGLPTTIFSFLGGSFPFNNTPENFAVGGPAVAAAQSAGLNVKAEYNGVNRYETAQLVSKGTFTEPFAGKNFFAVASGTNYPDAVVAAAFIANLDGPLLLSDPTDLYRAFGNPTGNPYTADYLQVNANNKDLVFVFGGTGSLTQHVQDQIKTVLDF